MVTFIAPAHNEPLDRRPLLISLLAQTNPGWRCIVYHNGPNPEFRNWVESHGDSRIEYRESPTNTGAWGCYNRSDALHNLNPGPNLEGFYIIQTSIQDTYHKDTVEWIHRIIRETNTTTRVPDIILWDSINHLTGPDPLIAEMSPGKIDWGNAAVRTSLAQLAGINHPEEFMADWLFFQTIMDIEPMWSMVKINQVLTKHN